MPFTNITHISNIILLLLLMVYVLILIYYCSTIIEPTVYAECIANLQVYLLTESVFPYLYYLT